MKHLKSIAILASGMLLAGCVPSTPVPVPTSTATAIACEPSPILTSENGFSEIQGTMHSDGGLWALLFFGMANTDVELKIVWRIVGTDGEFTVEARHEDGTVISPAWGPEFHEGSTWERPGEEWGTGFNFPKPGCWTLTVTRGTTIGEIRLRVFP